MNPGEEGGSGGRSPSTARLEVAEPNDEVDDALAKVPSSLGQVPTLFGVLARNPRLLRRYNVLGGVFRSRGILDPRLREQVILRASTNIGCEYEFGHHRPIAHEAGVSEAEVIAIFRGDFDHPGVIVDVLRVVDELCADQNLTDDAWERLRRGYDDAEIIEVIMLVGFYWMTGALLRSMRIDLEPGYIGWPR